MTACGTIHVVGLGPGERSLLTPQTRAALDRAEVVVAYAGYLDSIEDLVVGKECLGLALGQEVERARLAVASALAGREVCVVSSGDPGIYGMAGIVLETVAALESAVVPEVVVLPGVSSITAAAALLGAPLGHDFAVISLSDLLTPWPAIEKRLSAATEADFVLALLNPRSQRRDWQLRRACEILLRTRAAHTPVGIVRNACRPGESIARITLDGLAGADVDMFSTVIVGNSATRRFGAALFTPRGYRLGAEEGR